MSNKNKPNMPDKTSQRLQVKNEEGQPMMRGVFTAHSEQRFVSPLPPPETLNQYKENGWEDCLRSLIKDANDRENRKIAILEEQERQHSQLVSAQITEIKRLSFSEMIAKISSILIILIFAIMIVYSFYAGVYKITLLFTAITIFTPILLALLAKNTKK